MQRIFISDLHLEDPESPVFLRFCEFLHKESKNVDEIYILGDLVEMWIGDDDKSLIALTLKKVLGQATRDCKIYLMHGNRDFLFGPLFCHESGVRLIDDPHLIDDKIVLTHGDLLCTDDHDYQKARKTFRDPTWQKEILKKSLEERVLLGKALRAQSREANTNKTANIMDANPEEINNCLLSHQAELLIHGHTHRPGHYSNRIVTGAWEHCGWLCRQLNNKFRLECFSLAHHYGNETQNQLT